jgi:hypothetical protein
MGDRIAWLQQRFGDIWPEHTRAFGDLLIAARRHFDGDLDCFLILAVVGSRTLSRDSLKGLQYGQFLSGRRHADQPSNLINVQSISAVTGIPRESVRRKVNHLLERGWLVREGRGLVAGPTAAVELRELTEATLRYIGTLLDALERGDSAGG